MAAWFSSAIKSKSIKVSALWSKTKLQFSAQIAAVGDSDGLFVVGDLDGPRDGESVGPPDGDADGEPDGEYVGIRDGEVDGLLVVGDPDGEFDGDAVGDSVIGEK